MNDTEHEFLRLKRMLAELHHACKGHEELMQATPHNDHRERISYAADRVRLAIEVLKMEGEKFAGEGL